MLIFQYKAGAGTSWNLSNISGEIFAFSAPQDTDPTSLNFSTDGTKMYMLGTNNNSVYQYSLSTAWDLSTASYDSKTVNFSGVDTSPDGIAFKPDGTRMFFVGRVTDAVHAYDLSAAWDISTATQSVGETAAVGTQDGNARGVWFKPDGTKMYVVGSSRVVYQYGLSTAWDLSSASYDSVSLDASSELPSIPGDIAFRPDGSVFYLLDASNDNIYQYSLSTAWDLSTASYDSISQNVPFDEIFPSSAGIAFSSDGLHVYVTEAVNDEIVQFDL